MTLPILPCLLGNVGVLVESFLGERYPREMEAETGDRYDKSLLPGCYSLGEIGLRGHRPSCWLRQLMAVVLEGLAVLP